MCTSHAINNGCLVTFTRFIAASSKASFLGPNPHSAKSTLRKPAHSLAHLPTPRQFYPRCLGLIQLLASVTTIAPRLLSTATNNPPDVCLRSSLLALTSVILTAANLQPCLASVLNCSSISSLLNLCSMSKKISHVPLYLIVCFCCAPCRPNQQGAPQSSCVFL